MQGKIILLCLLSVNFVLMGCSVFSPVKVEPVNTYLLSSTPAPHVKKTSSQKTVLVNYPYSNAIYNTTEMAYSTAPFEIAYFSKNQWAETPSQMLQPLIVKTLQNTHYFRHILTPGMMGQYHFILNTQLLKIQQVFFHQSSTLQIVLKVQWINAENNQVIATKEFSIEEPAAPTPYGGVIAANRAVAVLLGQLAEYTVKVL